MIKRTLIIVSTFIFLSAFSQKPAKPLTFKIDGSIRNFSGKTVYLHHKSPEKQFTDSAKIINGKFAFSVKSTEPSMYWFTLSPDFGAQANCYFFPDETPTKAILVGDSLPFSVVEGGQSQKDYMEYRMIISNLVGQQQRMQADYQAASQTGDNARMMAIQQEFQTLNTQYVSDMKSFIKTHPKSAMSAYIVGNDFNNDNIAIENVIESLAYLDNSLAGNTYVKAANKKVDAIKGTMIGFKANNFTQNSPEGKPIKLSDFKGQYVLIDFWASWCKPCRMENPNVVSAYNRFKSKGFTVLGISMDNNKELWTAAIKADNLTWQHVSDLKGWGNEVGILYGVKGIPQNFLIDKEGKIVAKNLRGAELDEKLAEIIK
jgi:peroxiredoxin